MVKVWFGSEGKGVQLPIEELFCLSGLKLSISIENL